MAPTVERFTGATERWQPQEESKNPVTNVCHHLNLSGVFAAHMPYNAIHWAN